ncbi:hypothetical protein P0W64_05805 [Tsukamurella sp. 8F]|uniref:hypothetical protein n=1 Tax=unclassified Tsukamurella TaxID=2633480 RepID=UPI0023B974B5|nr:MULTISPECIES: hypothetical protein [unclassified Tsukamurella]MDF0528459.1 hypothetical protein [Tsukamurella sp. 8J]MDF0586285.1 hypothetical protein [Tsukamurella sp. 8F]
MTSGRRAIEVGTFAIGSVAAAVWAVGMVVTMIIDGHWVPAMVWGCYDATIVASLAGCAHAVATDRTNRRRRLLIALALLLCVDALLDVATSSAAYRTTAIGMALGLELPTATACLALTRLASARPFRPRRSALP